MTSLPMTSHFSLATMKGLSCPSFGKSVYLWDLKLCYGSVGDVCMSTGLGSADRRALKNRHTQAHCRSLLISLSLSLSHSLALSLLLSLNGAHWSYSGTLLKYKLG